MSTEAGVDYIKKIFSYNAKSGIYYKNIAGEYILIAKFTFKNVDIYKISEMPESSVEIDGKIEIYSFDPDNSEHRQSLNNLLK
ncbi:MAG: hypothetical protein E7097_05515 [Bacteroides sp.]|nr:hypothetical protein [Bacteroides sp.]